MDKSWMIHDDRRSKKFADGVNAFLDFAFTHGPVMGGDQIKCPCGRCNNSRFAVRQSVMEHLYYHGMAKHYRTWFLHGEARPIISNPLPAPVEVTNEEVYAEDLERLVRDAYGVHDESGLDVDGGTDEVENEDLEKLLQQAKKSLYPGCDKMSVLSFVIKLWNIKIMGGWSNASFESMLKLLHATLPDGCNLPKNFTQCKKIISDLGLDYIKIHACPNDCILYYKENSELQQCPRCGQSRYSKKKSPAKILRYFPLKARLQRLYTVPETATEMRWHDEKRSEDGILRHPADSEAWKDFDVRHPTFAADSRNVRLGLASDGFNPFRTMNISHSTWPVVLIPYNLPPWLCMKQSYMILSMLIPGPKSPGNNIDVYLRPLVDELKELWEEGIDTYDASKKETFKMHASLLWTISDYPGLAMLSGWSTKGKLACSTCGEETDHLRLRNWKKEVYMGHRRFLPMTHRFRRNTKEFNGKTERRVAPNPPSGPDILQKLKDIPHEFGRELEMSVRAPRKRGRDDESIKMPGNWRKLSIFYELPYWKDNLLKHNLDVMHIEKNICDSILGTIMDFDGKSKDNKKARLDLKDMGIRQELWPQQEEGSRTCTLPATCYSTDKKGKELFLNVLKNLKTPDGYASNISTRIDLKQRKIIGLKSHDSHVIMQQLLPLAIRKVLPKKVCSILIEFSTFFRELCSKVGSVEDYKRLEEKIPLIMCNLERIFPPSFFDIMVHLAIHLASEAKVGGPVQYRWMYPIQRFLYTLKNYVRNKAQPEGSIAEGYIVDESVTFMTRYMSDVETRSNVAPRYTDDNPIGTVRNIKNLDVAERNKIHHYILSNDNDASVYVNAHKRELKLRYRKLDDTAIQRKHIEEYGTWFKELVKDLKESKQPYPERLDNLVNGIHPRAVILAGYTINGYNFKTVANERDAKTQNYGVAVDANQPCGSSARDSNPVDAILTYYGRVTEILEITYGPGCEFVIFKCDWVDVCKETNRGRRGVKIDDLGFTLVNFYRIMPTQSDEPYVLASQVRQVFYVEDLTEPDWHVVVSNRPRDIYDMNIPIPDTEQTLAPACHDASDEEIEYINKDVNDVTCDGDN